MWALDDGEKIIGSGEEDGSILTQKLNGDKREWTVKNGQITWKLIPQKIINISGCICSRNEYYTCDAPCGYPAQQKLKKEREEREAKEKAELKKRLKEENKDADEAFSSKYLKGLFNAFERFLK
jgi:hypothetical protein